jgi:thiamine pyrophosphate-dependent acetolactate synthase large subunit-like protein
MARQGVGHVFEVCGGAITHLLDSLYGKKSIMAVSMHHEQAAAFAAQGYARAGGKIGVALATSGPGATNLITGIGSAFFDSTATVFITGQVNTYEFKFKKPVRQVGFQETDIVTIVKPLVKEAHLVTDPAKVRYHLERAFATAQSGRPGPVLLDLPMDVQRGTMPAGVVRLPIPVTTRLDTRQTGTHPSTFARATKLVHVDIDPREINHKIKADIGVVADLKDFLATLNTRLSGYSRIRIKPWQSKVAGYKMKYPSWKKPRGQAIEPNHLMHRLSRFLPAQAIVCLDVGQHQMWAGQSLELKSGQRLITQGGMAAMGSSLPLAIGAALAAPRKTIVVITGDGGFQLNMQELQTVRHHRLPLKIILLSNQGYGMIRQFQKQYFHSRFQSTVRGYSQPDFIKVVSAYGIHATRIAAASGLEPGLARVFKSKKPEFLELMLRQDILVLPKLAVGRPLEEQDPPLSRKELKENMYIKILPGGPHA